MAKESEFQAGLIKEIKQRFPGSVILKNDANYIQGFPDLLILHKKKWAALECKKDVNTLKQPNQQYYIEQLGKMSYANFVYPENKEEILGELQQAFGSGRTTRVPRS